MSKQCHEQFFLGILSKLKTTSYYGQDRSNNGLFKEFVCLGGDRGLEGMGGMVTWRSTDRMSADHQFWAFQNFNKFAN